jgi:hypothetical protein
MIRFCCDGCRKTLQPNDPQRYILRIELFAAAEHLQVSPQDLARDHRAEIQRILNQLQRANPDQIEDQVFRAFRFDLCADCHQRYLRNPLPELTSPRATP